MPTTSTSTSHNHSKNHHLILIHGAWAGSWVWEAVGPHFKAAGYTVHALDLPGQKGEVPPAKVNLDLYCAFVQDKMRVILQQEQGQPPKITLIAHSGAGVIALQVAERLGNRQDATSGTLHSLVIVAGMMLPSGLTYTDFRATLQPQGLDTEPLTLEFSADGLTSTVPEHAALQCFFQDWPDQQAAALAARKLSAQPTGGLNIAATYDANGGGAVRIPKLYVEATLDASVLLPVQRAMQGVFAAHDNANLRVVSMETGHVPHVVQPEAFCRHVCDFLAST